MDLLEPQPTSFDLRFRVFRIPVRVHPTFWLFTAIFGWQWGQRFGFGYLVLWIVCSFLSILVHELGHAGTGLIFGKPGKIVLYSFGGVAIGEYGRARFWQRILITAAGPAVGLLLFLIVWLFKKYLLQTVDPVGGQIPLRRGIEFMLFMNLFWNLMNLLPVIPLDGGQLVREVAQQISPRRGYEFALILSTVFAGTIAVYSFLVRWRPELWYPDFDPLFPAIFFAIMAVQTFMAYRDANRRRRMDEQAWNQERWQEEPRWDDRR